MEYLAAALGFIDDSAPRRAAAVWLGVMAAFCGASYVAQRQHEEGGEGAYDVGSDLAFVVQGKAINITEDEEAVARLVSECDRLRKEHAAAERAHSAARGDASRLAAENEALKTALAETQRTSMEKVNKWTEQSALFLEQRDQAERAALELFNDMRRPNGH